MDYKKDMRITDLPADILLEIFSNLDYSTIKSVCQINDIWKSVSEVETLWKNLCSRENDDSQKYILKSRLNGLSWKESFISNYGPNLVRKKWSDGLMSDVKTYDSLPALSMCEMGAEDWGDIFEKEEARIGKN